MERKIGRIVLGVLGCAAMATSAWAQSIVDSSLLLGQKSKRGIIFLKEQPGPTIGQAVRRQWEPQIEALSRHLLAIQVLLRPAFSVPREQEPELFQAVGQSDGGSAVGSLNFEIDRLRNAMVEEIATQLESACRPSQSELATRIQALGGSVESRITVLNGLVVRATPVVYARLAKDPATALIADDHPGGPELDVSTPAIFAPDFWTAGYSGSFLDVGVLDTGVQQNHPAFAGKVFESSAGTTDPDGHGTAMGGIMAGNPAANPTLRGVAWGVDAISVATAGTDATSMNGMNYLMTGPVQKAENVNYSFGNGTASTNDYAPIDQFFDGVIDTFGIMVSKSTGNGGFGTGAPTITHPAPAFNLIATANMNDMGTTARADDRISSSSSRGPTASGRKKPDITSPGTAINSPNRTGGYTSITGTSPASPHSGAAVVLLLSRGVANQMAAKAILLNSTDAIDDLATSSTTDDVWVAGSLWNRRYGWGYTNLQRALLHAMDYFQGQFNAPPSGTRRFALYKGAMFANERATLTWNRHVGFNGAAYPTIVRGLSNLDLACYVADTNALHAQSASAIDNVEQFHVASNINAVLKVYTTGTFDPNVAIEKFALATEENFNVAAGPAFSVTVLQDAPAVHGVASTVRIRVQNTGEVPAHATNVTISGIAVSGSMTQSAGIINPGQTKDVVFNVTPKILSGEYIAKASISSASYGETFTGKGAGGFIVN